ncbi:MAG: aminotransferase class I/II-fold pyridoxal phosphate-dependent enzyme [Chloroflexota bacterium]|nr:aminotransferase class I/II-fold pyridoxal phosphate-dependent enzyme [Chloroflexota bacterium]
MPNKQPGIHTLAIHAGEAPDPQTGALVPPLHLASTFHLGTAEEGAAIFAGEREGYVYSRWGNPTTARLEERVAALENAPAALCTGSGMAAIMTSVLNVVRAGDHIVSAKAIYPSTYHLFDQELRALGIETTFVDATDPQNVAAALRKNTKLVYLETPGNPILALCDLAAIAQIARAAGVATICDSTFATPINQHPLDLGVDVVVHSATKYLCGHGDAVGGVIVGHAEFIKHCADEPLRYFGGILSPFNAYLISRGTQTLPLRMERHNANALAVAQYLEQHPKVGWVSYPGLESHPQHTLATRQMRGFGGMVCFDLKGGVEAGARLMNSVKLCALAVSFGDVRSLITHPASTTHTVVSREQRLSQGVTDGLVRLSVGLEDVEDIIADLEEGL